MVGYGEYGEEKAEIMSSVELSFRHSVFEVFMRCSWGDVQQAAGYTVEPHVINILNVCRLTVGRETQRYRDTEKGKTS